LLETPCTPGVPYALCFCWCASIVTLTQSHTCMTNGTGPQQISPLTCMLVDGWCWFVLREKYRCLVAGGWFVLREKYCWLVADKPNEQGGPPDPDEWSPIWSISISAAAGQRREFRSRTPPPLIRRRQR
jgi:hypothetical protein